MSLLVGWRKLSLLYYPNMYSGHDISASKVNTSHTIQTSWRQTSLSFELTWELTEHAKTHLILKNTITCVQFQDELPSTVVEINYGNHTLTSDNSIWKSKWYAHRSFRLTYGFKCILFATFHPVISWNETNKQTNNFGKVPNALNKMTLRCWFAKTNTLLSHSRRAI